METSEYYLLWSTRLYTLEDGSSVINGEAIKSETRWVTVKPLHGRHPNIASGIALPVRSEDVPTQIMEVYDNSQRYLGLYPAC